MTESWIRLIPDAACECGTAAGVSHPCPARTRPEQDGAGPEKRLTDALSQLDQLYVSYCWEKYKSGETHLEKAVKPYRQALNIIQEELGL